MLSDVHVFGRSLYESSMYRPFRENCQIAFYSARMKAEPVTGQ